MNIFWKCPHPQAIQDVDEVLSSADLEKCIIPSLAHQWILCSEWVPSEVQTADKNITVIHDGLWTCILVEAMVLS